MFHWLLSAFPRNSYRFFDDGSRIFAGDPGVLMGISLSLPMWTESMYMDTCTLIACTLACCLLVFLAMLGTLPKTGTDAMLSWYPQCVAVAPECKACCRSMTLDDAFLTLTTRPEHDIKFRICKVLSSFEKWNKVHRNALRQRKSEKASCP